MADKVYISITGLKLRRPWFVFTFWAHAVPAMQQALAAEGCLRAQSRTINGIHHTLSVWRTRDDMRNYLAAGAHLKAMKVHGRIATGKVVGFEAEKVPDWSEVHRVWQERGREV